MGISPADRFQDVYAGCEEPMLESHPSTSVTVPLTGPPPSSTSANNQVSCHASPVIRGSQTVICALFSFLNSFLFHLPYYLSRERSCFASVSTFWCLASIPITEVICLTAFLIMSQVMGKRQPPDYPDNKGISEGLAVTASAMIAVTATFVTLSRTSQLM